MATYQLSTLSASCNSDSKTFWKQHHLLLSIWHYWGTGCLMGPRTQPILLPSHLYIYWDLSHLQLTRCQDTLPPHTCPTSEQCSVM